MKTLFIMNINGFSLVIDDPKDATKVADTIDARTQLSCTEIRYNRRKEDPTATLILKPQFFHMTKAEAWAQIEKALSEAKYRFYQSND